MRNQTFALTSEEHAYMDRLRPIVADHHRTQRVVRLDYVKRPRKGQTVGDRSFSIGTISDVFGNENKTSVTVFTDDKGPRTVNLYRIIGIRAL